MVVTRENVISAFISEHVEITNISICCYNTAKFVDTMLDLWNNIMVHFKDGRTGMVTKWRNEIFKVTKRIIEHEDIIGDNYIAEALYLAIMSYDGSTLGIDRPFEDIQVRRPHTANTSWLLELESGNVDEYNSMICTLLIIREFAINGFTQYSQSSLRSNYFAMVCRYIRSKYHLGFSDYLDIRCEIDHVLNFDEIIRPHDKYKKWYKRLSDFILRKHKHDIYST